MSSDHRKPVVAFVMLVLAAALVIGVQQAEADGGRLLAAPAGVGAHVQGSIASPTETLSSRDFDRLADLGPAFASLRELVGHADARTVAQDTDESRGTEPAAAGAVASPAVATLTSPPVTTRTSPAVTTRTGPRESSFGKSAPARSTAGSKAPARKTGPAASGPASQKKAGPTGSASTTSPARSSVRSSVRSSGKVSATSSAKARNKSSSKARKATRRVHARTSATVRATATSWKPGKSYKRVTKASPRSVRAHRSARAGLRPARVAATSRATGVPASAWHRGKGHGKR